MNHRKLGFLFLLALASPAGMDVQAQARRADAAGSYARNTAEGWRRYTEPDGTEVEIIPDVPRIEYLDLRRLGKAYYRGGRNEDLWEIKGRWKISQDTISIKYVSVVEKEDGNKEKGKYIVKYYFTGNCGLRILARQEASFYRIEPECN